MLRNINRASGGVAGEAVGDVSILIYRIFLIIVSLVIPPAIAFSHLMIAPNLERYSKVEHSFASSVSKFYYNAIPKAVVEAWTALPDAEYKKGSPEYKFGSTVDNMRWRVAARYVVAGWCFIAVQAVVIYIFMQFLGRIYAPLKLIPIALAITHYAVPFYLDGHFAYLKYIR